MILHVMNVLNYKINVFNVLQDMLLEIQVLKHANLNVLKDNIIVIFYSFKIIMLNFNFCIVDQSATTC